MTIYESDGVTMEKGSKEHSKPKSSTDLFDHFVISWGPGAWGTQPICPYGEAVGQMTEL